MADRLVFDWDEANIAHVARHNFAPEEVEQVLQNDPVDLDAEVVDGEERYIGVGHTEQWTRKNPADNGVRCERPPDKAIPGGKGVLIMAEKNERMVVPKFKTEAEEAQWWFDNRNKVEDALVNAMDRGTALRGVAQRLTREARASRNITIRMADADLDLARAQAEKKGLPYQTYIKSLLHEALTKRARRRAS